MPKKVYLATLEDFYTIDEIKKEVGGSITEAQVKQWIQDALKPEVLAAKVLATFVKGVEVDTAGTPLLHVNGIYTNASSDGYTVSTLKAALDAKQDKLDETTEIKFYGKGLVLADNQKLNSANITANSTGVAPIKVEDKDGKFTISST